MTYRSLLVGATFFCGHAVLGQLPLAPSPDSTRATGTPAAATRVVRKDSVVPGAQIVEVRPGETYIYTRPGFLQSVRNVPRDLVRAPTVAVQHEQWGRIGAMAAATAVLVAIDDHILAESRRFGRQIHLGTSTELTTIARFTLPIRPGGLNVPIAGPANFPSFLYFLGDGWTSILTAGGFYAYGTAAHDNRALRTASEISEALIGLGIVSQALKHISGRESPSAATSRGGTWRPFPSLSEYGRDVPRYDAFPSGHMASAMAAVTVVALNYPSNRFVKPVGYSLLGVVGYQMVNNRVHWAGDYPVALAIGGLFAKIAVDGGRTRLGREQAMHPAPPHGWRRLEPASLEPTVHGDRAGISLRFDLNLE
ncbi:MAG: hypothetical protein NVS4B3_26350 [Gemmatimonadaceae bacterium]